MVDQVIHYTFLKRGIYYFSKRIPSDMKHLYSVDRITYSLKTNNKSEAYLEANTASLGLERYWRDMRASDNPIPAEKYLKSHQIKAFDEVTLKEAESLYLKAKSDSRSSSFTKSVNRAVKYLISVAGNKNIEEYTRKDANLFRDSLLKRSLTGTG